jgi:hypothetical protein
VPDTRLLAASLTVKLVPFTVVVSREFVNVALTAEVTLTPVAAPVGIVEVTPRGVAPAAITTMLKVLVAVDTGDEASVTWRVNVDVPAVVGVPLITPAVLRVKPVGSVPVVTDQLYGKTPPLAVNWVEG